MNSPQDDHAVVAASNGKIYAMGGVFWNGYACAAFDGVEEYDPNSDSWQPMVPMSTARWFFGAASTDDGKVYAIGGATKPPFKLLASVEVATFA